MRRLILTFLVSVIWCLFQSCFDNVTDTQHHQNEKKAELYQIPGCAGHKPALAELTAADSCFSYEFETSLIVEFCITANCCPDSNRFELSFEVVDDTITVVIADTAANLCRCVCTYHIHAEFTNLPLNRYHITCQKSSGQILYKRDVWRKTPLAFTRGKFDI